jgi:predicted ATPase/DNA-binding CsgD family transcriptional regulator
MSTLPVPLTRFVGREVELADAAALLAENRLLTLTGPGGAGKTRLALQLAASVAGDLADGAWFVDLSPLSGGEFVWDRVALALGVKEPGPGRTWADVVGHHLQSRQALLILDNCEHVVETAAEVVASVLVSARNTKVLTTSRQPLGVAGEVTWAVPALVEADAVELFNDRARQALPQFRLHDDQRAAVVEICNRLDGLPLAIELAAARTRALTPARIAAGLKDRLAVLSTGPRSGPRRQATLEASFDWSYDLLSEPERALLRQLSVFAGGFDVEAALAVCPAATLELLASLADRSLIIVESRSGAETRYRLLETVRQFAAEHLDEAEEVELMRTRHRDYYTEMAEKAEPGLTSPDDARWQALLLTDQENLRAAMAWSRDRGDAEALARLVAPLGMLWTLTNRLVELTRWMEAVTPRAGEVSVRLRARLRYYECLTALFAGDRLGEVPALAHESLALARAAGSKRDEATALAVLSVVAGLISGAEAMRPYVDEAVRQARAASFHYGAVMALEFLVLARMFQSRPEENWAAIQEAIAVSKNVQRHTQLTVRFFSGLIAFTRGQLTKAEQILTAVVAEGREMSDFNYLHSLIHIALVQLFRGDFDRARSLIDESLAAAERSEAEQRSAAGVGLHASLVLGWMQLAKGDVAEARQAMAKVAEGARSSILRPLVPLPLILMADACVSDGALDEATAVLAEAVAMAQSRDQTWFLGRAGLVQAKLRMRKGDFAEAESLVHEALNQSRDADDQIAIVDGMELLARIATNLDSHKEAARLWAAADSRRAELDYARFPVDFPGHDASIAAAKNALGADEFASASAEGMKLSIEEAIAYAARGRGERKRPSTGWASLTPSELEVARLVGEHLSNPEIAARLFVSRATVKTHLVHIFAKLGIESRSELAAQAISRRQTSPS